MNVKCLAGDPPESSISDEFMLDYRVPQGSCLGNLLFLMYCNNLPLNLTFCNSILFADDTMLYKSHNGLKYLKWCLQEELKQLVHWFKANKLTLNLKKSVCMLFDEKGRKLKFDIELNQTILETVDSTKFLGVWIDKKLCWDLLILKIKRNMHLLRSSQNMMNVHAKKLVYFAHTQSHISYCLSVWGNLVCQSLIGNYKSYRISAYPMLRIVVLIKIRTLGY